MQYDRRYTQRQLIDTNTHTHWVYKNKGASSSHDNLEVKLQEQRHSTCVPLCISKARIIFKIISGKTFGHCPQLHKQNRTIFYFVDSIRQPGIQSTFWRINESRLTLTSSG